MSSSPSLWNEPESEAPELPASLFDGSAVYRFGVADAGDVDPSWTDSYNRWLELGLNASMDYLRNYPDLRSNPEGLLPGVRSVIVCAISYHSPRPAVASDGSRIASYALGTDYHRALRRHLRPIAAEIERLFGGQTRICIDSAPVRERYWAVRAGLGGIGLNTHLLIPGAGSMFFLAEILTTARFRPSKPLGYNPCTRCGKCVRACPAGALSSTPDGLPQLDARRCLSYLTIEHRGPFAEGTDLHHCLFGCDACALACPLNANPPGTTLAELRPRPEITALTAAQAAIMTEADFDRLTQGSPLRRAGLEGLRRNGRALLRAQSDKSDRSDGSLD